MFDSLVAWISRVLPDYGQHLAIDGKALASYARDRSKEHRDGGEGQQKPDGRRDIDAK